MEQNTIDKFMKSISDYFQKYEDHSDPLYEGERGEKISEDDLVKLSEEILIKSIPHIASKTGISREILKQYFNDYSKTYIEEKRKNTGMSEIEFKGVQLRLLFQAIVEIQYLLKSGYKEFKIISESIGKDLKTKRDDISLILSWGMGSNLFEMLPMIQAKKNGEIELKRDEEFLKVLRKEGTNKNLIIVFEQSDKEGVGGWTKGISELMKTQETNINGNPLMQKIVENLNIVTSETPIECTFYKPSDNSVACDWNVNGIGYTFVLIMNQINPFILMNYFNEIVENTGRKMLICNDFGQEPCEERFNSFNYYNNNFSEMIWHRFGNKGTITKRPSGGRRRKRDTRKYKKKITRKYRKK